MSRIDRVQVGNGGWCWWATDDGTSGHVRFARRGDRWIVVELHLDSDDGITSATLRRVPVALLESQANGPLRDSLAGRAGTPGPDLRTAVAYFTTTFGKRPGHWAGDMILCQVDEAIPRPPTPKRSKPLQVAEPGPPKLDVPSAPPFPPQFYEAVAEAYSEWADFTTKPAQVIADANGVQPTQVHRWVRVCRSRGLLGPALQGKAGQERAR